MPFTLDMTSDPSMIEAELNGTLVANRTSTSTRVVFLDSATTEDKFRLTPFLPSHWRVLKLQFLSERSRSMPGTKVQCTDHTCYLHVRCQNGRVFFAGSPSNLVLKGNQKEADHFVASRILRQT